ncbi:hypothetical protein TanjilG_31813 [Lupinus angustifolius]|uniref:CRAL-TRIO domain-containing protein n=1 Tax=Lupinus angustifolius TaxID=3871 RepID=A0A4P1RN12_LUPAN|nr:PREDICTED: patellin-4-like [Lupinus angustifolius]XP_019440127.1 PREDICTED: patellin-4-like [Lupinus angustifolius]OIW13924.1 hypothetical protein TanjilG_31813 [Lupinus angustifolius]
MTAEVVAEVKAQEGTQKVEVAVAAKVEEPQKVVAQEENVVVVVEGDVKEPKDEEESKPETVEKSSPFKEESNFLSDLKEFERKALNEFRTKLEEAILGNTLFEIQEPKKKETKKEEKKESANAAESDEKKPEKEEEKKEEGADAAKSDEKKPKKEEEKKEEGANAVESDEKKPEKEEEKKEEVANAATSDEKKLKKEEEKKKEGANAAESDDKKPKKEEEKKEEGANAVESDEKKPKKEEEGANVAESDDKKPEKEEKKKEEGAIAADSDEKKPEKEEEKKEEGANAVESDEKKPEKEEEEKKVEVDKDVSLWGVPLLPSKGAEGTDVVLLKYLMAKEFKVNDAFEMLKKTLQWRKESNIDSIVDEEFDSDLASTAYMLGSDREGHPVCYNIFGVFESEELYQKTFGTEESRFEYLRWRCQLLEKSIQKLNFKPGSVSSLLQINDLKNSPGPYKILNAANQAVAILQDNYPEMVAKNIIINAPYWYYALNALSSPFLTQRAKSKFVVSHPAKVMETLIKYIPIEEIPVQYGGFKRENDFEFSAQDGGAVSELTLKAGSTATIEIPASEVGYTLCWDFSVLGWEVSYKEEFVPTDESSYTIIVQKEKKIVSQEEPIRNTFRNNEAGKVIITLENTSNKKKKVLYRYKTNIKSSI